MDRAALAALQSQTGQTALAEAMALAPEEASFLSCFNRLSRKYDRELARAAVETAMLRRKAVGKFARADAMYFIREALEQSTSELVAHHRATRFAGLGRVADLGCGVGGDAVALAAVCEVAAVDRDGLRLDMARLNARAYGVEGRCSFHEGDALTLPLPPVEAVFVDPDRRPGGRRRLSPRDCEPPLDAVRSRFGGVPLAAKLAPGVPLDEVDALGGETEFVSLDNELKECVLWLGSWRTTARRATALPSGESLTAESPAPPPPPAAVRAYLIDPGPAVTRAGLVGELARRLGAWPVDASVAYLTADAAAVTPFARCWRVRDAMPFHLGRLRDHLRSRGVGRANVLRRGSPIDPDDLVRRLKLSGPDVVNLVLTPVLGEPWAVICDAS